MRLKDFKLFNPSSMTDDAVAAAKKAGSSRRDFLRGAGILMVGFSVAAKAPKLMAQSSPIAPLGTVDATQVDSWIAVGADESVTCYTGKVELGQGIRTVQYQLIAEELSVDMSRINLIMGITGICPDQGTTSGSQSTITEFSPGGLRQALDTARDALMQLASEELDTPVSGLSVTKGVVWITADPTQSISYGKLVYGRRFNLTLSSTTVPKDPATWTILGTSVPRVDIPAKATGSFTYVQNVRVPGMLHGKVLRPQTIGAHVVSIDSSSLNGMPGNPQVVQVNDFVGVVADSEWHAINAVGALNVSWTTGATLPAQASLYTYMQSQPSADSYTVNSGDVPTELAAAVKTFKAQYLYPYQMHGSIGSSCAVADVRGGTGKNASAKIWTSTQGPYPQRDSVSTLLGIPNSNVQVFFVDGSGCYGLNGADNVCYDAALMSQAVGAPVRVQYSRRDEMAGTGENYGTPYVVNLQAGVDKNGTIITWDYEGWTVTLGNRPSATAPNNIPTGVLAGYGPAPGATPTTTPTAPGATFSNGSNVVCNYVTGLGANGTTGGTGTVASQRALSHTITSPFFTGPLRSPARLQNTFANESFMDEMAAALKVDPIAFRTKHLADPRLIAVLTQVAAAANWDTRPSPKPGNASTGVVTGRGVSCVLYEGNNGYCAMVAQVSVDQGTGIITVTNMFASQDSGPISNPNGMRNQMEGGALQGVSRALYEQVSWSNRAGIVTSEDWVSYPVYQFGYFLPGITTVLINQPEQPSKGSGECTITLVGSAIANAVFDATGVRMRQVPFTPATFQAAQAPGQTASLALPVHDRPND
jgi:CO/xanthine dehydrogenase Mo-binding subunit